MSRERVVTLAVRILSAVGIVLWLAMSLYYVLPRIMSWSVLPDFTVFWSAGRVANPYDTQALTLAQAFAVNPANGPRPFPYPPPALFLVMPFALLPFWTAYWVWNAVSAAAFWSAARRVVSAPAAALAMAAPHTMLVFILGQTSLLLGALVIWSLSLLRSRPFLAGVLVGLAGAIKPQVALLAPVAFISGRHWRALAGAAAGLVASVLASLPFGLWDDWLSVIRAFPSIIEQYKLFVLGATPAMAARTLGVPIAPIQIAGIVAGVWIVWMGFRRDDLQFRLISLVCGTLLASPYAMRYELAILSPVFAAALLSRRPLVAAPAFMMHSVTIVPATLVSAISSAVEGRRERRS